MNKVEQVFANGKAFIPFITAGDPSIGNYGAIGAANG